MALSYRLFNIDPNAKVPQRTASRRKRKLEEYLLKNVVVVNNANVCSFKIEN